MVVGILSGEGLALVLERLGLRVTPFQVFFKQDRPGRIVGRVDPYYLGSRIDQIG